jgi:Tfp pilus assembly protein PilN
MEPITLTAVALFLTPFFTEAGKTLAVESVKLALEKRQDIKDKIIDVCRPEFTSLNLNDVQSLEEVKALIEAKPDVAAKIQNKIEANSDLLDELAKILSKQEGRTIHTHNYIEHIDTAHFN